MRAAVVGGGIFGCTTAVDLARAGHTVDLYERHPDILLGASRSNQGRLHRGYHYPRDPAAKDLAGHARRFVDRFPTAVYRRGRPYYAVAAGSRVDAQAYRDFCDTAGLAYWPAWPALLRRDTLTDCLGVTEWLVDVPALRAVLRHQLRAAGVRVRCGFAGHTAAAPAGVDLTVWATYGQPPGRPASRLLRYEVCETALVRLGAHYTSHSVVVVDGPYVSLDPVPGSGLHMLYDVVHSVHHANVGTEPEVPDHLAPLLDRGPVRTRHSRVDRMEQTARLFLSGIGMPEYHGSLFTVRAVLPDVDDTDERPTLVEADGDTLTVLSGKICTAPWAAEQVVALAARAVAA